MSHDVPDTENVEFASENATARGDGASGESCPRCAVLAARAAQIRAIVEEYRSLRELHREMSVFCHACGVLYPCAVVLFLDQLEAALAGVPDGQ